MNTNDVAQAVKTLTTAFQNDPDFRYAYQANIAMAFVDTVHNEKRRLGKKQLNRTEVHAAANKAADNFLTLLSK